MSLEVPNYKLHRNLNQSIYQLESLIEFLKIKITLNYNY